MKFVTRYSTVALALALGLVVSGCGQKQTASKPSGKSTVNVTVETAKKTAPVKSAAAKPSAQKSAGKTVAGAPSGSTGSTELDKVLGIAPNAAPGAAVPLLGKPAPGRPVVAPPMLKGRPGKPVRPTPQQLMGAVQMRYATAKTFRLEGSTSTTVKQDGKTVVNQNGQKFTVLFKKPNKFSIKDSGVQFVSDGSSFYTYSPKAKRYMKSKMSNELLARMVGSRPGVSTMGMLLGANYSKVLTSMKMLPDAKISGRDTFVVTFKIKQGVGVPKGMNATQTLWVGKRDLGIYKNLLVADAAPQAPKGYKGPVPKRIQSTVVNTFTSFEPDAKLADSTFRFSPPSGAKLAEAPKRVNPIGKPAADFSMKWPDGTTKKLSDFRGKTVVLYFMALPQSAKHLPVMQDFYSKKKDELQIIALDFSRDASKTAETMKSKGCEFTVVPASEQIGRMAFEKYGIVGVPTLLIIDSAGVVRDGMMGDFPEKDIEAKLAKLK